jgi:hypothetical protein
MNNNSAEVCSQVLGYDPGEEGRRGATGLQTERTARKQAEVERKLGVKVAEEERGYGLFKREETFKEGLKETPEEKLARKKAKEERGVGIYERKAKIGAKYRKPTKEPTDPIEKIRQSMVKGVVEFNRKNKRGIEAGYIKRAEMPSTQEIESMLGMGGVAGPKPQQSEEAAYNACRAGGGTKEECKAKLGIK